MHRLRTGKCGSRANDTDLSLQSLLRESELTRPCNIMPRSESKLASKLASTPVYDVPEGRLLVSISSGKGVIRHAGAVTATRRARFIESTRLFLKKDKRFPGSSIKRRFFGARRLRLHCSSFAPWSARATKPRLGVRARDVEKRPQNARSRVFGSTVVAHSLDRHSAGSPKLISCKLSSPCHSAQRALCRAQARISRLDDGGTPGMQGHRFGKTGCMNLSSWWNAPFTVLELFMPQTIGA
jgi:hypothetical protein